MREDLRYFRIASGLVFADDLRHLEARDLLHQQDLQLAVVGACLRDRHVAAAVVAPVADADQRKAPVHGPAVELYDVVPVDPLHKVYHRGQIVGALAADQRQVLVALDRGADPRVDADGTDGQAVILAHLDQIQQTFLRVQQTLHIGKGLGVREVFDEIVAGAAGIVRHGQVLRAGRAADHLVEGAVAAAGVDADLLAGGRRLAGDGAAVAGLFRDPDGVVQPVGLAERTDRGAELYGLIVLPRRWIDDEQVLHVY